MSQIPDLQKIAEDAGALLMPIVNTEGHCLYIKGKGNGFFSNETLEQIDPDHFRAIVAERSQPRQAAPAPSDPVARYVEGRRRRSVTTGHFLGGDR